MCWDDLTDDRTILRYSYITHTQNQLIINVNQKYQRYKRFNIFKKIICNPLYLLIKIQQQWTTKAIPHLWNILEINVSDPWESPSKTNFAPPSVTGTGAEITWCMMLGYLHSLANESSLDVLVELITKHCTCPLFGNNDLKSSATVKHWVLYIIVNNNNNSIKLYI